MTKQLQAKNQNTHPINDLPKLSPTVGTTFDRYLTPCNKTKHKQKQGNKQNMSPVKVKQFVKLFHNSNSNARILKISPYCNNMLKNKLISALEQTVKLKQKHLLPYRNKTRRVANKLEGFNFSIQSIKQQNLYDLTKMKGNHSIQVRDLSKTKTKNSNARLITIQIFHEEIQLQLHQSLYTKENHLSTSKLIQILFQRLSDHKFNKKLLSIVGFKVVELIKRKQSFQTVKQSKNKQQKQIKEQTKGIVQATTYLLSIGKLNIQTPEYQKYSNIILKPIFPKRAKQFIDLKLNTNDITMKNVMLCDFDIIKCLGSGGFSSVFLVRGNFNNKYYAMKLIDKGFILETQRDGIIENQRYILQTLSKRSNQKQEKGIKFITQLSFSFQTVNHFIFMIQYCPGGQLFNQLKKVRKMTEDQAKFYFLQILISLDYIHSHSILYRDLKPQNLLIDADGHIKIADFGLSKPLENFKSFSYSFCGSPEYMAPQMLTKSGHNYLLDYYCLGALLYELVVGVPPYYSLKQQQIYQSILNEELGFPKNIGLSPQIISLLTGLLKKDTKQRLGSLYGVKQIMCHPWIGRINKATIQNRELIPPFVPNLNVNNFDPEQIKTNIPQIMDKLKSDSKKRQFQTHFSEEFTFINPRQKLYFLQNYQNQSIFAHSSRNVQVLKSCTLNNRNKNRFSSSYNFKSLFNDKINSHQEQRRLTTKPKSKQINKMTVNLTKSQSQGKKLKNRKFVQSLR